MTEKEDEHDNDIINLCSNKGYFILTLPFPS